jgi:hypothetical protein
MASLISMIIVLYVYVSLGLASAIVVPVRVTTTATTTPSTTVTTTATTTITTTTSTTTTTTTTSTSTTTTIKLCRICICLKKKDNVCRKDETKTLPYGKTNCGSGFTMTDEVTSKDCIVVVSKSLSIDDKIAIGFCLSIMFIFIGYGFYKCYYKNN